MAFRLSMSEDTFLKNSTSPDRKRRSGFQQYLTQTKPISNNCEAKNLETQNPHKCSNIRVMQLFYEMKQEFPNIPDDVVNQHVIDNIHNPEKCKARLHIETESYLVPVQSYPAQLLRDFKRDPLGKKRTESKSPIALAGAQNKNNNNRCNCRPNQNEFDLGLLDDASGFSKNNAFNQSKSEQSSSTDIKDMRSGVCSIQITTYSNNQNEKLDVLEKEPSQLPLVPKRPTTLMLKKDLDSKDHLFQGNSQDILNQHTRSKLTGSSGSLSSYHSVGSTTTPPNSSPQKFCRSINTVTTIQSPTVFSDPRKSEILVNVSLSPSSHRNRTGATQRHQSTITVRPELPFTRNLESAACANHKSYTSVNLVLRQPSSTPQSPIDITVGPNLTYSSSSYHARLGYQNNYHITVTDDGGIFSAFRIHPLSYNNPTHESIDKNVCDETPNELNFDSGNSSSFQNSIVKATNSCGETDARKVILRQHNQKERLLSVILQNKNKLSLVRKEVDFAMQSVITDGVSESLDCEIEKLRCDCQTMLNEIENSRINGLSEESIEQTNSIKSRQAPSFPKHKPLRLPAPSISVNCFRNQQRSFPNEVVSPRQPSITYRDDNSDFGAGD